MKVNVTDKKAEGQLQTAVAVTFESRSLLAVSRSSRPEEDEGLPLSLPLAVGGGVGAGGELEARPSPSV